MHLRVICTECEKKAIFNTTLGIYYCPQHGYETKLQDPNEFMGDMISNLEQIKVFV
jgi:hypothetical protein